MRDKFPWYFIDGEGCDAVWDKGILTVDANVILDLYRYNALTREAILTALEDFQERFWISHQTSKEFIKNRRAVISDIANEFANAEEPVSNIEKEIEKAASSIRSCRAIPKNLSEDFDREVRQACKNIREKIEDEQAKIPDFEQEDEIIERLEKALDGRIGSEPDNISEDIKEAQRRKDQKIPPGYMDSGKEGLGFAGDYLMWKQILSHCNETQSPMILVTSETKDDWWERKSGKTLNPRLELLQESFEETGQKILIYHTDYFLQLHKKRSGAKADESVLEEIREYSLARDPAVSVSQFVTTSDTEANKGSLRISVARPVRNFTGSGRFYPLMSSSPEVSARLVECPEGAPEVTVRANTGTTFDFNVHVHSRERAHELPVGEYLVEYEASCGATNGE